MTNAKTNIKPIYKPFITTKKTKKVALKKFRAKILKVVYLDVR